jgi:RHS repeat-associated protein
MLNNFKYSATFVLLFSFFSVAHGQTNLTGPNKVASGSIGCYSLAVDCGTVTWSTTIGTIAGSQNCLLPPPPPDQTIFTKAVQFPTTTTSILSGTVSANATCGGPHSMLVQVIPPLGSSTITPSSQTVSCGGAVTLLSASLPTGGDGTNTYVWQSSPNNSTWTNVPVINGRILTPSSSTQGTMYYRIKISSFTYSITSASVSVTFTTPPLTAGSITPASQDINSGAVPATISCTAPSGGSCSPNYQYQWFQSTDNTSFVDAANSSLVLSFSAGLTQKMYYKMKVTETVSGSFGFSGTAVVNIYPALQAGNTQPASQTIDYGKNASTLSVTGISGGNNSYTYQWQASSDNITWNDVSGMTTPTYAPASLTGAMWYRAAVKSNGITQYSVPAVVNVNPQLATGILTPAAVTLAAGASPGILTVTRASGGACSGSYAYQWQSSTSGTSWGNIAGASDLYYNPGNLSSTVYYRVRSICGTDTAYTAAAKMTIGSVVTDVNYIRERSIDKPGVADAGTATGLTDPRDVKQTTQYFDGLGRLVQTVARQASPQLHDMVAMEVYDPFGREAVKYLPYTSTSSDGNYKTNPTGEQSVFNSTQFPADKHYYGLATFEPSPLDRLVTNYAAGSNWVGKGLGISSQYLYNTSNDSVRIWDMVAAAGSLPTSTAAYGAGVLYKNGTTDEQGHQVFEYKDKEGHVILKKLQLWAAPATGHSGWLCTYYVYDDLDNLRFVIQPKGVEWLSANNWSFGATGGSGIVNELCFRYEYDLRDRMIVKKVPGAGEARMVYDVRDRLVMIQDSVLRSQQKWQVICYDGLNRQDTVALMTDPAHYNDHAWHIAQAMTQPFYPFTAGYVTEVVTQLYYDSYNWVTALGSPLTAAMNTTYNNNGTYFFTTYNAAPDYAVAMNQYLTATGLATGSRSKVIGTTQFLYNIPFYDDHGRVIGTQSTNYTNGLDQEWTQYDFSGQPVRKLLVHKKNSAHPEAHLIGTKYTFDTGDRLTGTRKLMDGPEARIDTMMYDELGQLRAKYFANNVDSLVYDYNIRGWLTGINRKYLTGVATNYFGMELGYDNPASGFATYKTPQYNGNIAGTVWKSAGDGVSRKYDFSYDNVNRLTGADFTQYNGSTFAKSATVDFTVPSVTYDANGNIQSLIQNGFKLGGSQAIDRLRYTYTTNSNRLQQVYDTANDAGSLLSDFHYDASTKDPATDYSYDANGSLAADRNKGIRSIHYNFLNLPDTIRMTKADGSSKGNIVNKYDALGTRWAKIVTDSTVSPVRSTTTMYLKEFQYQNDTIQFVTHEEGRTRYFWQHYLNGDSSFQMRFDYFERDHLGSTRVILTDQRDTAQYVATMEGAYRTKENSLFYNIPATSFGRSAAAGYPVDVTTTNPNDSVIRLGANGQKMGPAIILKVMSGDKVTIATNYYFNAAGTTGSQQLSAENLINSLANGIVSLTGASHGSFSDLTGASTPLTGALNSFVSGNNVTSSGKPNAYLNWVLLDNQFAYVSAPGQSGAIQVATAGTTGGGGLQSPLGTSINLKTSGYLYIYVSNASPTWDVFFDNLSVMHYTGPMVEENHYYPFGLTMAGISDKALKGWYPENKYRYNKGSELQNKEFADGSGLEMYGTRFRELDPQLGRWWQIDPKSGQPVNADKNEKNEGNEALESVSPYNSMDNDPIRYNDPEGDCPSCLIAGIIGGIVDYGEQVVANYAQGNANPWTSNINLTSIGTSALAAGLTNGGSIVEKSFAKAAVKLGATVVNNIVEIKTNDKGGVNVNLHTNPLSIVKNTLIDVSVEKIGHGIAGKTMKTLSKVGVNKGAIAKAAKSVVKSTGARVTRNVNNAIKSGSKKLVQATEKRIESGIKAASSSSVDKAKSATDFKPILQ